MSGPGGRRVVFLIEALTTGGAQRQLYNLAVQLGGLGHRVSLVAYHLVDYNHRDHFRGQFERAGVQVTEVPVMPPWRRLRALRRIVRAAEPDVVIAFLRRPGLLAELTGLPARRFALIVSERTGKEGGRSVRDLTYFQFHRLADAVVANSVHLEQYVRGAAPWLGPRLRQITNSVDLEHFRPADSPPPPHGALRVLAVGRFRPEKNFLALAAALRLLRTTDPALEVTVDWYGNNFFRGQTPSERSRPYLELLDVLRRSGLEEVFRVHPPVTDVVPLYQQADVLCLPSRYESLPNVVCEALACGLPVLASAVSDNHRLVREGENGFLFDPREPHGIAEAVRRFAKLSADERAAMGLAGRRLAEELLAPRTAAGRWAELIEEVVTAKRAARQAGW
ncbi:glycosyltransferase family 4 protein [Saccharothrix sp. ST-888]|uniref:glycosyltransferase family 4 protein n=1 Tax=Saccharothrix sp. ST-888 TaxID=1427391 RepID=UPI0005ED24C4|nr:glycosyltransferase family 4 protein [Saccharothrix sp. ST-888]